MTPAQYNEYQRMADVIDEAKKWEEQRKYFISDEEIHEGIIKHCSIPHDRISAEINAMIEGAKWYREQLNKK